MSLKLIIDVTLIALIVFSPRLCCTLAVELQRVHSRMQVCTYTPCAVWAVIYD